MKPGRIFHFTFGAFSWLAVLTKASPVPTSLDHSYVLVPRTEGEPSVHQRSSSELHSSIILFNPRSIHEANYQTTLSQGGRLMMDACLSEKPQKKKRVKWLDEQMDPLGEASANTHETAGLGHDHPLMKIVISKAKEEWISSQAPIPSAVYKLQRNLGEKATGSRASLLKFASGEKDAQDQELLKWQTALMDSQQAMFMQIPTTAHDKQSVALQLLLECLKIFLFPVYRKVNYIAK
ncbi:hypothetical protein H0H93_012476, partial [Arthromyces matolae]